jgi:uncharacterized protein (DUF305 family)
VASAFRRKLAYLLLIALAAGGVQAQAPGRAPTLYSNEDLLFLTHMVVHHEQALELAALVPSRTTREELIRFARQVDKGQRAEIDQMKSLIALAAERGIAVPEHTLHGSAPMPGAPTEDAGGVSMEKIPNNGNEVKDDRDVDEQELDELFEREEAELDELIKQDESKLDELLDNDDGKE